VWVRDLSGQGSEAALFHVKQEGEMGDEAVLWTSC